jgi:hypothetical protein
MTSYFALAAAVVSVRTVAVTVYARGVASCDVTVHVGAFVKPPLPNVITQPVAPVPVVIVNDSLVAFVLNAGPEPHELSPGVAGLRP